MAVKLRLTRMGRKGEPFYRIVASDSRKARDGQCIESIGYYDPTINHELANKWIGCGAQCTDTVKALLKKEGIIK